jgi:hypothetical protein
MHIDDSLLRARIAPDAHAGITQFALRSPVEWPLRVVQE